MTQRTIKFRAWDLEFKEWITETLLFYAISGSVFNTKRRINTQLTDKNVVLMQFTGLLDKNGLQEVYEGDIVDDNGNIKGNIYQMDAGEADLVIEGFGTSAWAKTETGSRVEDKIKWAKEILNIYENPELLTNQPSHL